YSPVVRGNKTDITNAITELADAIRQAKPEESVIVISERMSNEELYLIGSISTRLGIRNIISSNEIYQNSTINIADYIGTNFSTAKKEDIESAEYIVVFGNGATLGYTKVFGFEIKKAVNRGAKLIWIGEESKEFKKYVSKFLLATNIQEFISNVIARIIKEGQHSKDAEKTEGFNRLATNPENENADIAYVAELFTDRNKKMVSVFNPDYIFGNNFNDIASIINLAIVSGRIDNSLVIIRNESNGAGYADIIKSRKLDFTDTNSQNRARELIKTKKAKSVICFNSDISDILGYKPDLLAVFDIAESRLSGKADYIIPASANAESEGSFVNYEGKLLKYKRVFNPLAGYTTFDALGQLLRAVGGSLPSLDSVRTAIANSLSHYSPIKEEKKTSYLRTETRGIAFAKMNSEPFTPSQYKSRTTYSMMAESSIPSKN
ncbi:MAG: molybdopterin-dependent oxidoreductase, partial [Deltaproteobacteria bacterium]|nr:molybdopterin-dependent oxidoreductase [Deltaproteobacteria bacterium]